MERARGFFQSVVNKQRMCPACRALIDRKEKTCPLCGERVSEVSQAGVGRAIDSILPQQARTTMMLLSVNVFLFGLTLVATIQSGGLGFGGMLNFGSSLRSCMTFNAPMRAAIGMMFGRA